MVGHVPFINVGYKTGSPLHGILAGVELFRNAQLTPFQEEMSTSVALAGRTLLDTVNHILDYGKISNLTPDQKRDRARADAARHKPAGVEEDGKNLSTVVDLAHVTEEVVESVSSAYRHSQSFETDASRSSDQRLGKVSVVLNIGKRSSWSTAMTPGSWTRVPFNIVGTALKYTPSGIIAIVLFTSSGHKNGVVSATLQVEDPGIDVTTEVTANESFVPFGQADPHSTEIGLGLSIDKEVVKEFKGSLDVEVD